MVGAELKWMHLRLKHAPYDEVAGLDRSALSTSIWDRYGPDICAELPLGVVDKLLTAYGAVETSKQPANGDERVRAETIATVKRDPEGPALLEKRQTAMEGTRDQLLKVTAEGFNALHPYFDGGDAAEGDQPSLQADRRAQQGEDEPAAQ